jgi:D-beta-D-heptose 7-phosphate kinase/D-beta-D-heptose 1-phosphate adenosyltransferase
MDFEGRRLLELLENADIDTELISFSAERPTTIKTRILAAYESKVFQQMLRLDREEIRALNEEERSNLLQFLEKGWSDFDAIILSDYNKGVLTEELLNGVRDLSRRNPKIITVDPKDRTFKKYRNFTILTPNQHEAEQVIGCSLDSEAVLATEGEKLRQNLGLNALLITLGKRGMMLFTEDNRVRIETEAREVFDVTGAGDTVISFLSLGLGFGFDYERAARMANLAAGIVVGKIGAATISREEFQWICKHSE